MKCNPWRWLWGLIPLAMLSWVALLSERDRIENDLAVRAQQALSKAGLSWASVKFDGRDGEVNGQAADDSEPDKAIGIAQAVNGVRVIANRAQLVEKIDTYTWQAALANNKVRLSGYVPNEETRKTILGMVKANLPNRDVEDRMKIARGAPPRDTWLGGVSFGLKQLALLKKGAADIEATNLTLSGEAEDTAAFKSVKSALARGLPQGVRLKGDKVTPPVVSPYLWSAKWAAKKLVLSGYAPGDAQRGALLSAVKKALPDAAVEDRMELADGAPEGWANAASAAIAEFGHLEEGGAELKGSQLTVAGMAPDEGRAEIVRRAIRGSMPSGIRFTDQIKYREPPKPDPAELEAKRRAEEEAKRRADEEAKRRAEEEAKRRADADAALAKRSEDDARRRAEADAKKKAEADAAAQRAAADAEAKRKAEAEAAGKRAAAAEAEAKRRAELQLCQSTLNEAKSGVIQFQRASADLDPRSFPTLDKVAKAALACPNAHIEIQGHTDAEGTPERNQKLSERRAQSIVSYLSKMGVDGAKLSAVGYGESRPVAPNDTPENRAKNRRIEFTVKN